MRLILLFISIVSICAFGQSRHIVLDLDGLLVQGIPSSKIATVTKQQVIQVTTDRAYTFVPRYNLDIFLQKLINEKNIISIHSTLEKSLTNAILQKILIKDIGLLTLIKSNLGSISYGDKLDLTTITSEDNILAITSNDNLEVTPSEKTVKVDSLYYYDTFDLMKAEYESLETAGYLDSHKDFVTNDKAVYESEYYKLSRIYYSLLKSNDASSITKTLNKNETLLSAKVLASNELREFEFIMQNGSCYQMNLVSNKKSWTQTEECIEKLGAKLKWHARTCAYLKDGEVFKSLSMSECINELPVTYVWRGKLKRDCYAYAQEYKLNVARSNCKSTHVIEYNNKSNLITTNESLLGYSTKEILDRFLDYKSKFSLKSYNEKSANISGVEFPRTKSILWRTMGRNQYDYANGILAMFGDHTQNVESKAFTHIRLLVSGKQSPFSTMTLEPLLKDGLDQQLKLETLSDTQAVIFTEKLMDDFFENRKYQENEDKLVNYRASTYLDWNPRAVFAALSPGTCHIYGKPIMVSFNQKRGRSIDLNYWNYVRNSVWSDYTADIGEFLVPSHVEASDIESVLGISSGSIHTAFMKSSFKGETILLGFRKPKTHCLIRSDIDNKIYACDTPVSGSSIGNTQAPVTPNTHEYKPQFIVKLCPKDKDCNPMQEIFDYFDVQENYELEQSYLDIINELDIDGQRPRVFYSPTSSAN